MHRFVFLSFDFTIFLWIVFRIKMFSLIFFGALKACSEQCHRVTVQYELLISIKCCRDVHFMLTLEIVMCKVCDCYFSDNFPP
jgi:hypothetical protein